jgi:hypothetical protein
MYVNGQIHVPAALPLTIIVLISFLIHAFMHQSFRPLVKGETPEEKMAGT